MQVCLIVYDVLVDTRFLKLTIKTWKRDLAVFIANFEQNQDKILYIIHVFLFITLNMYLPAEILIVKIK